MTESGSSRLPRSSSVPLWRQLSDHLRQQIHTGVLRPGARMPTEVEMGSTYGVSRITVRAAIEKLLAEQLVVRAQGKGTFVAGAIVRQDLSDLAGIIPNLEAQGIAFETRLITYEQVTAPPRWPQYSGSKAILCSIFAGSTNGLESRLDCVRRGSLTLAGLLANRPKALPATRSFLSI